MINYLISFKDVRCKINHQFLEKFKYTGGIAMNSSRRTIKSHGKYYSEDDKSFSFIMTLNDRTNMLFRIVPSKLYINIPYLNNDKWIEFNLKQMKHINSFSTDIKEIEDYFRKIVFLNKFDQIALDQEKLDSTNPISFKCMINPLRENGKNANWITSYM
jgi:hypothetical protein